MAHINYAVLGKSINNVIEYIFPKTTASIVEYANSTVDTTIESVEDALNHLFYGLANVSTAVAADYYNKTQVDNMIDSIYSPIVINSVSISPTYAEVGTVQNVTLSWDASRKPFSITVDNVDRTSEIGDRLKGSFSFSGVSSNHTYTVAIKDHKGNGGSKTATIKFVYPVFWGKSTASSITTEEEIVALASSGGTSLNNGSKAKSKFTMSFTNQYFYYAYQRDLGTLSAIDTTFNGTPFALESPVTVNCHGTQYYVYRSHNKLTGTAPIVIA